jgi:multisubunit Na+/H+ antiporter MnhG subunit
MPPKGAGAYSMAIFHKIVMLLFLFFKKTPSKFQLINRGAHNNKAKNNKNKESKKFILCNMSQ